MVQPCILHHSIATLAQFDREEIQEDFHSDLLEPSPFDPRMVLPALSHW